MIGEAGVSFEAVQQFQALRRAVHHRRRDRVIQHDHRVVRYAWPRQDPQRGRKVRLFNPPEISGTDASGGAMMPRYWLLRDWKGTEKGDLESGLYASPDAPPK